MHRVAPKFVPRLLTQDQRDNRVAVSQELWIPVILNNGMGGKKPDTTAFHICLALLYSVSRVGGILLLTRDYI